MRPILLLIFFIFFTGCYNREEKINKQKLIGNDFRLFQETPVWSLAKAVEDEDIKTIKKILADKKNDPDYPEPKFGNTLLMLAITNSKYKSVKELLNAGANPNKVNSYRGTAAMIAAAVNDDPKYLKLLLDHKGNPNALEIAPVKENDEARSTPLNTAISLSEIHTLDKVKLLVEAGADINYFNEGNPSYTPLPLSDALVHKKIDVALYLLKKGADYNKIMYTTVDGHKVYILEGLRKVVVDLTSNQYKAKIEVIQFLKSKGLDYSKEPIPDYIEENIKKKYPNNWEEYLEKY